MDNDVDFSISHGEPYLSSGTKINSGATVWKPVCVFKPRSENSESNSEKSVLSVEELVMHLALFYTKAILKFGH